MTDAELKKVQDLFPNASPSFLELNGGAAKAAVRALDRFKPTFPGSVAAALPHAQPEPDLRGALATVPQTEAGRARSPAAGADRPRIHITLYRVRLLDTDNKWASVKPLLDSLRYAGVIADDRERDIELIVEQVRVSAFLNEGTGVVVEWPL